MDRDEIEQTAHAALARLDAALTRLERAAESVAAAPRVDPAELAGLQQRHSRLKHSVAQSLRQLDDILAGATS
ncbi:hypothetical protein ACFO0A_09690 [Novosphingobium tardum]|uniref:DUF904 domain-containing protein n=1 Tax=Novosphingobium tardum TaxID=1538021 RepID=A0ABV8RPM0_9SPHN